MKLDAKSRVMSSSALAINQLDHHHHNLSSSSGFGLGLKSPHLAADEPASRISNRLVAGKYHRAAIAGYVDMLCNASKREANLTVDENSFEARTPTQLASQSGHLDALRILVGRGGDPEKADALGWNCLHLAAANNHLNCVSFLVNFGVNMWALNNDLHTAKDLAAIEQKSEVLDYLDQMMARQSAYNTKSVQKLKEKAKVAAEKRMKQMRKQQLKAIKQAERDEKYLVKLSTNRRLLKSAHSISDIKLVGRDQPTMINFSPSISDDYEQKCAKVNSYAIPAAMAIDQPQKRLSLSLSSRQTVSSIMSSTGSSASSSSASSSSPSSSSSTTTTISTKSGCPSMQKSLSSGLSRNSFVSSSNESSDGSSMNTKATDFPMPFAINKDLTEINSFIVPSKTNQSAQKQKVNSTTTTTTTSNSNRATINNDNEDSRTSKCCNVQHPMKLKLKTSDVLFSSPNGHGSVEWPLPVPTQPQTHTQAPNSTGSAPSESSEKPQQKEHPADGAKSKHHVMLTKCLSQLKLRQSSGATITSNNQNQHQQQNDISKQLNAKPKLGSSSELLRHQQNSSEFPLKPSSIVRQNQIKNTQNQQQLDGATTTTDQQVVKPSGHQNHKANNTSDTSKRVDSIGSAASLVQRLTSSSSSSSSSSSNCDAKSASSNCGSSINSYSWSSADHNKMADLLAGQTEKSLHNTKPSSQGNGKKLDPGGSATKANDYVTSPKHKMSQLREIHKFLVENNLLELADTFANEKIDLEALMLLTEDDMKSIGIVLGPRKKLLRAMEMHRRTGNHHHSSVSYHCGHQQVVGDRISQTEADSGELTAPQTDHHRSHHQTINNMNNIVGNPHGRAIVVVDTQL